MTQLNDLQVRQIKVDENGDADCLVCGDPLGIFDQIHVHNTNEDYLVCSNCGAIFKVKE